VIHLRQHDNTPTVAACQAILNAHRASPTPLVVDGSFGPRTREAVQRFQSSSGIPANGEINPATWQRLAVNARLHVRDILDISDPLLMQERPILRDAGACFIEFGGGSNAVAWVVPSIARSGVEPGSLLLLRFQGHGNRGSQVIGYGTGCHVLFETVRRTPERMPSLHHCAPDQIDWSGHDRDAEMAAVTGVMSRSRISTHSLALPDVVAALRPLRNYFSPFGSIEFHGCQVGGGNEGASFLRQVSQLLGVPASGARQRQQVGNCIRFGGPVFTAYPNGVGLRDWASSLPPF